MITKDYYKVNYSWTSLQRPPRGQKKVAIVERFKQESMYGLSAKKSGRYKKPGKRWSLWKWSFVEVRLHHKFRQLIFLQHAMDSKSHNDSWWTAITIATIFLWESATRLITFATAILQSAMIITNCESIWYPWFKFFIYFKLNIILIAIFNNEISILKILNIEQFLKDSSCISIYAVI